MRESYTIKLDKCYGSGISFVISKIFLKFKKNLIFVCDNREKAMHHIDDFEKIVGQDKVMFFPSSVSDLSRNINSNNKDLNFRTEIVSKIKNKKNENYIIVSYPEAICIKVANQSIFKKYSINLKKNLKFPFDELIEKLFQFNFEKVNFVTNPGEFYGPDSVDFYDEAGNQIRKDANPLRGYPFLESARGDSGDHNFITVVPGYTALDISFPDASDIEALFTSDIFNVGTGDRDYFIVDRTKIVKDRIKYEIEADQSSSAVDGMACEDPRVFGYVVQDSSGVPTSTVTYYEENLNFFDR